MSQPKSDWHPDILKTIHDRCSVLDVEVNDNEEFVYDKAALLNCIETSVKKKNFEVVRKYAGLDIERLKKF